jgi:8-oxo-dGTP diphosphatase
MHGDGDGWVHCSLGHRHWGLFGAAGILISDGRRAILQHRAPWTHEGDTWGLPGGARDSHEDPTSTALREATEEAALHGASIEPVAMRIDDHGGWSYTTVLARPRTELAPHAANAESTEIRWWPESEVAGLPLHHGLAATWPHVRRPPPPLLVVIDTRSDLRFTHGRDAGTSGSPQLAALVRYGIPAGNLPIGIERGGVTNLLPSVALVVEDGTPAGVTDTHPDHWWRREVEIHPFGNDPRAAISRAISADTTGRQIIVVTDDPSVRTRLNPQITIVGPGCLAPLLDDPEIRW